MNDHVAHARDIVRVHPGIRIGGRNAAGIHLTVVSVPAPGRLELSEWSGDRVHLAAADVDVVTRSGVA